MKEDDRFVVIFKGTRKVVDGYTTAGYHAGYSFKDGLAIMDRMNARARELGVKARYDLYNIGNKSVSVRQFS